MMRWIGTAEGVCRYLSGLGAIHSGTDSTLGGRQCNVVQIGEADGTTKIMQREVKSCQIAHTGTQTHTHTHTHSLTHSLTHSPLTHTRTPHTHTHTHTLTHGSHTHTHTYARSRRARGRGRCACGRCTTQCGRQRGPRVCCARTKAGEHVSTPGRAVRMARRQAQSRRRCGRGEPSPIADVGRGEPSPGADVGGVSPSAWSRRRCGRGEPI